MTQPTVSLEGTPPPAATPWFVLTSGQKGTLVVVLLGILYLRIWRRKRARIQVCSHCGAKNPPHQSNCHRCAAPLPRIAPG